MRSHPVFFSKGCPENLREEVKGLLQVPKEALSAKYFGLPSDVGTSKNGAFKYLKDYLWSKVQEWIEKTMSSARKDQSVGENSGPGNSSLFNVLL
jgi:hypothetical protein